jgi:hypothetical protein
MTSFEFAFDPRYRAASLAFGITPRTARVLVGKGELLAKFGPWRVHTALDNIVGTTPTGPYTFIKTGGPARLSFTDRGLTFATNGDHGLCIEFAVPVTGLDPTGLLKHPGLTVTVADIPGLAAALLSG